MCSVGDGAMPGEAADVGSEMLAEGYSGEVAVVDDAVSDVGEWDVGVEAWASVAESDGSADSVS